MATFTTNYLFRKPATSDTVSVTTDISDNMDDIDTELKTRDTNLATAEGTFRSSDIFVRKTADTARSSTTTLADDPHLVTGTLSTGTYEVKVSMFLTTQYTGTGTAGEFKVAVVFPTGTLHLMSLGGTGAGGSFQIIPHQQRSMVSGTTTFYTNSLETLNKNTYICALDGYLNLTATGTFKIQWAQYVSSTLSTSILTNSFIILRKVSAT